MNTTISSHFGIVTEASGSKKHYNIILPSGEIATLPFEELEGTELMPGDILELEISQDEKRKLCISNPIKVSNIHLENLKHNFANGIDIEGYVYAQNSGGFKVSFRGYSCFLPNSACEYKILKRTSEELLFKHYNYSIGLIQDGIVMLSLKNELKANFKQMLSDEIESLKVGMDFLGTINNVTGFGIFVNKALSAGLLHLDSIIPNYDAVKSSSKAEKKQLTAVLSSIFIKGEPLQVFIEKIEDGKFSLNWDKNAPANEKAVAALYAHRLLA